MAKQENDYSHIDRFDLDQLRQVVTGLMTNASKKPTGTAALKELQKAQLVISLTYGQKETQQKAQELPHDLNDVEYFMLAEMARDIARFYWKVAEFSGQPIAYDIALQWIERAYELTQETAYAHALLYIEHVYTRARGADDISDDEMNQALKHLAFMSEHSKKFAGGAARVLDAAELLLVVGVEKHELAVVVRSLSKIVTTIGDLHGRLSMPVELPIYLAKFVLKYMAAVMKVHTAPDYVPLPKVQLEPETFGKQQVPSTPLHGRTD